MHIEKSTKSAGAKSPRSLTILGSTGSVGVQTLDVVKNAPDSFTIDALVANSNVDRLAEQAVAFRAKFAVIAEEKRYEALKTALSGTGIEVAAGQAAVVEAAKRHSDVVMSAIVGAAGLPPTLAAVERGAAVAFANKETLVCAGSFMMKKVVECGAKLLPVDSEHNAIWQVFDDNQREHITRIILTASGGPFRKSTREEMAKVTAADAVKHPIWKMGAKISIDSATLMNKALEVIEAHFLFNMPKEKIDVIVHPQSVIHSMVEYSDGSVLAQLGSPDMRTPIASALAWPQRMASNALPLDFTKISALTFEAPDEGRFPALRLAREALAAGGTAPCILNAANEVAVQAFLDGRIRFLDIEYINANTRDNIPVVAMNDLDTIFDADARARSFANRLINGMKAA